MHRASRKPVFQMIKDGKKIPCDGELWYRGYNIYTLIRVQFQKKSMDLKKSHIFYYSESIRENVSDWNDIDILFQIPGKEY